MPNNVRLAAAGLLVSGLVVLVAAPATASDHHTWVVEPGTGTISAAVASASPGDTLQLEAGTFYDSVFVAQLDAQGNPVPKSLTITGEGDETVISRPPSQLTTPAIALVRSKGFAYLDSSTTRATPSSRTPCTT